MTRCTVASRHACNLLMIEAILCAASLSLCYTATCYNISGCIGSCWCMGDSKCKDSTLHIQAEQTQIQWKQPLLVCCFHDDYNIMARRICINRFWLAGGKAIILLVPLFIKNVVAVAAYSRLASRSQAKFHTKKLSPLVRPCAAAPAQSTTSAYRSLRFSPR